MLLLLLHVLDVFSLLVLLVNDCNLVHLSHCLEVGEVLVVRRLPHVPFLGLGLDGPLYINLVLVVFGHALVQPLLHLVKHFLVVILYLLLEFFHLFMFLHVVRSFLEGQLVHLLYSSLVSFL